MRPRSQTSSLPMRLLLICTALVLLLSLNYLRPSPTNHPVSVFPPLRALPTTQNMSAPLFTAPLHTSGRYIVDAAGRRFKLLSANWYGGSDIHFVPSGLDVRNRSAIATQIRSMGFNSVRLPYSDQMVRDDPPVAPELLAANEDLVGMTALQVFAAVVEALTDAGLAVVVNDHVTRASWCDGMDLCDASWKNNHLWPFCKVRQSETEWIENWAKIMTPLKDNKLVVGADLRNEPRGLWGTMYWGLWADAAEKAAERLLAINKDWLMIVEGVGSANDVSGARDRPVKLSVPDRVVYSAHVFAWSGWGQFNKFSTSKYGAFSAAMRKNWAYLLEENVAPVWVAEMGAGIGGQDEGERNYWANLMRFLAEVDADWGYWALNPRKPDGNEVETWRLVNDDWKTAVEDYRMEGLRGLMGQRPMTDKPWRDPGEGVTLEGDSYLAA